MGRVWSVRWLSSEAVATINGTVVARFKRDLAGVAALCTNCSVHLTGVAIAAGVVAFACIATGFAALGFIGKALFCKKLLLAGGESELLSAIFADDGFVVKHLIPLKK